MKGNGLPQETSLARVALYVTDLERSITYYQDNIGLTLLQREDKQATLGVGNRELLLLTELAGLQPVQRGRTGLYHFAILVPSRRALARVLRHLAASRTPIGGASDHGVSEALYLSDPDGHGIEIYRDRPRAEWPFVQGSLQMVLDPLQTEAILAQLDDDTEEWWGLDDGTCIGHVHLHEEDIAQAEHFYVEQLGFELMQRFGGSASFVSAGGYHHHLGLNVWAGVGAPPPDENRARLQYYEISIPDVSYAEELRARLQRAGHAVVSLEDGVWSTHDPSGIEVRVLTS